MQIVLKGKTKDIVLTNGKYRIVPKGHKEKPLNGVRKMGWKINTLIAACILLLILAGLGLLPEWLMNSYSGLFPLLQELGDSY